MTGWPFIVFIGLVVLVVLGLLGVSFVLGQRTTGRWRNDPYESGVRPASMPRGGISIEFYRVAVFFVIFDVETVFLFAWAVALREAGWRGFTEMAVFLGVLVVALAYLWRSGSLDWRRSSERERRQ
jgi:NADH-quinone oxidoreductase subunit A